MKVEVTPKMQQQLVANAEMANAKRTARGMGRTPWVFAVILLLIFACLLFAPLPTVTAITPFSRGRILAILFTGLFFGRTLARAFAQSRLTPRKTTVLQLLLLFSSGFFGLVLSGTAPVPAPLACLAAAAGLLLIGFMYLHVEDSIESAGIFSFLLFLSLVFGSEVLLQSLPSNSLLAAVRSTPPLVPVDQVNVIYKEAGFRGKRACEVCPENNIRILTMGGSSTNGIPMHFSSRNYSAELQRLLESRRPAESFEVLNGGIGGFGIMQVISALEEELLPLKPDIVTVCSWFNDTAPSPGWYSLPGLSDKDGYYRSRFLQKLQNLPVYKQVRNSRLYALARFYTLLAKKALLPKSGAKSHPRPRMTPEEFAWGLEKIIALGNEHSFLPVFVVESLNRSRSLEEETARNEYLQVMYRVAREHNIPVVDTLNPLNERAEEWLFYDFIHPNPDGHVVIAEAIYQSLFGPGVSPKVQEFLSSHQLEVERVIADPEPLLQFSKFDISANSIDVEAQAPFLANDEANLEVFQDGKLVFEQKGLGSDFSNFKIPVKALNKSLPIIDLRFKASVTSVGAKKDSLIGETGVFTPSFIDVVSGGKPFGWTVGIHVQGKRVDYDLRGYNVVILGAKSGEVKTTGLFDIFGDASNNMKLRSFVLESSKYTEDGQAPIVIIAVKTDGRNNAEPEILSETFRAVGGSGDIPEAFESFAIIGVLGAAPGSATEDFGPHLVKVSVGSKKMLGRDLLSVRARNPKSL